MCFIHLFSFYSSRHLEAKWDLQERTDNLNLHADNKEDEETTAAEDDRPQNSHRDLKVMQLLEYSESNATSLIDDASSVSESENGVKDEADGDDARSNSSPTCPRKVVEHQQHSSSQLNHTPFW